MAEIIVGENVSPENAKILMTAILFHDSGIGQAKLPQIREQDLKDMPDGDEKQELIEKAIESRLEHARIGRDNAEKELTAYLRKQRGILTEENLAEIYRLILNHNNSKISLLKPSTAKERLIPKEDWLLQMHREADALWMLSADGIQVDLDRQPTENVMTTAEDGVITAEEQIHMNAGLHREEMQLYVDAFGADADAFEFIDGTLYRTQTGYKIFKRLHHEDLPKRYRIPVKNIWPIALLLLFLPLIIDSPMVWGMSLVGGVAVVLHLRSPDRQLNERADKAAGRILDQIDANPDIKYLRLAFGYHMPELGAKIRSGMFSDASLFVDVNSSEVMLDVRNSQRADLKETIAEFMSAILEHYDGIIFAVPNHYGELFNIEVYKSEKAYREVAAVVKKPVKPKKEPVKLSGVNTRLNPKLAPETKEFQSLSVQEKAEIIVDDIIALVKGEFFRLIRFELGPVAMEIPAQVSQPVKPIIWSRPDKDNSIVLKVDTGQRDVLLEFYRRLLVFSEERGLIIKYSIYGSGVPRSGNGSMPFTKSKRSGVAQFDVLVTLSGILGSGVLAVINSSYGLLFLPALLTILAVKPSIIKINRFQHRLHQHHLPQKSA